MKKRINSKKVLLLSITYLILIAAALMSLVPLGWIVSTSIKGPVEVFAKPPRWVPLNPTAGSYVDVLQTSNIPRAFWNSFLIAAMAALLALLLGGLSGYAFARFRFRGNKFLSFFMLISQMLPVTVLMIPLYYMFNNLNALDTKIAVALSHLTITLPISTWMSRSYFRGIPREIEEAAMLDGCGTLKILWYVILPIFRPAIAATGVYAFISSWNEFALANVLTMTMNSKTLPLALNDFSSYFKVNWGNTMAAATIITIPVVLIFMLVQKQFVRGLASGSVKG